MGLALEARQPIGIRREPFWQDLDRHVAAPLRIASPIHVAHAARPERSQNLVWSETSPDCQRHNGVEGPVPIGATIS